MDPPNATNPAASPCSGTCPPDSLRRPPAALTLGSYAAGFLLSPAQVRVLAQRVKTRLALHPVRDVWFTTRFETVARMVEEAHEAHVTIPSSKTDQRGDGTTFPFSRSGSTWLCPIPALWERQGLHREPAHRKTTPHCTSFNQHGVAVPVTEFKVRQFVRRAAAKLGKEPVAFTSHSRRSAGATAQLKCGTRILRSRSLADVAGTRSRSTRASTMWRSLSWPAAWPLAEPPRLTRGAAVIQASRLPP